MKGDVKDCIQEYLNFIRDNSFERLVKVHSANCDEDFPEEAKDEYWRL